VFDLSALSWVHQCFALAFMPCVSPVLCASALAQALFAAGTRGVTVHNGGMRKLKKLKQLKQGQMQCATFHSLLATGVCCPDRLPLAGGRCAEEDSTRGLGCIKGRLDQDELPTHADFARAIRKALSPCTEEEEEEGKGKGGEQARKEGEQARKLVLELFEEKYRLLADEVQLADELAVCRFLPRPLHEMPQRRLQGWCIMDNKGQYLAPWHASHASSPGGVFGTLVPAPPAPGRLKSTDQGAQDKQDGQGEEDARSDAESHATRLKVRLNAPDEWQAQCLDPTGCALPQYWLRGCASMGAGSKLGPRGGPGKVWYQLATPAEGYQEFLRRESWWLMGSWRIAHFLHAAPKSTFNEVAHAPPQAVFPHDPWLGLAWLGLRLHHPCRCLAAALRLLPSPVPMPQPSPERACPPACDIK